MDTHLTPEQHKAKFDDTVSILVKAYLNDTLQHENCAACAVGNIIAAKRGYTYNATIQWVESFADWYSPYSPPSMRVNECGDQIVTGYSVDELSLIEYAFEESDFGQNNDSWIFNGLMSVVDVLATVHSIDLTSKESAKTLFIKT